MFEFCFKKIYVTENKNKYFIVFCISLLQNIYQKKFLLSPENWVHMIYQSNQYFLNFKCAICAQIIIVN